MIKNIIFLLIYLNFQEKSYVDSNALASSSQSFDSSSKVEFGGLEFDEVDGWYILLVLGAGVLETFDDIVDWYVKVCVGW